MSPQSWVIAASLCFKYYLWKSRNNTDVPSTEHPGSEAFLFLIIDVFYSGLRSSRLETVMKQSKLDSMSIDELLMLHERITATLEAKISAERKTLIDRLKQADMSVH